MAEAANTEDYAREVGQRIIAARREFGMSQKELAELVQVSERSMQSYESGQVVPYRKLKDLAMVLNVSTSWILHGEAAKESAGDLAPILERISEQLDRIVEALTAKAA